MEFETIKNNIIEFIKNSKDYKFIEYLNGFITEYSVLKRADAEEQMQAYLQK